jgi:hypothetical protein
MHSRVPEKREKVLCIIETVFRVASIAMAILATELTIAWNKIQGVNDTKSVGQLIPLMIGVGGIGHVLLVAIRGPKTMDEMMQEYFPEDTYNMAVLHEIEEGEASDMGQRHDQNGMSSGTSARTSATTSISSQER